MRFQVTRTAAYGDDRPCDDERLALEGSGWFIDFADLGELMQFVHDNGGSVVIDSWLDVPFIEIYDDYRE